jgi:hypothetical protein
MSELQILCLFILFAIANIRPLFYRHSSINSNPKTTISVISMWGLLGIIILMPFYGDMFIESIPTLLDNPYLILLGFTKGASIWCLCYIGQQLRKQSNSSCAYSKQISIAGVAIINGLQGEVLHLPQWGAVIALACLGIIFGYKGHISELSTKYKLIFVTMVVLCIVPATVDYAVISQTNWYTLMVLMVTAQASITLFKVKKTSDITDLFTVKRSVMLGVMMLVTEIAIMMILVTHVPVTMAVLTMSLSVPTMMVVSSLLWKEGHWKQQLAFGCAGYLAMLPMILL